MSASEGRAIQWHIPRLLLDVLAIVVLVVLSLQLRQLKTEFSKLKTSSLLPRTGLWLPSVTAINASGDSAKLAAPHERQLLLYLQSNCRFCRESLTAWNLLADTLGNTSVPKVKVIGVQLDTLVSAESYVRENGLRFPVVRFQSLRDARVYAAKATPFVVVVDSSGRVEYARPFALTKGPALDSVIVAAIGHSQAPRRR